MVGLYYHDGTWHVVKDSPYRDGAWMRLACNLQLRVGYVGRDQGVKLVSLEDDPPLTICETCLDQWTVLRLGA